MKSLDWARSIMALAVLGLSVGSGLAEESEPGPEDGGMRLRLVATPREGAKEGFDVRVELLNVGKRAVVLRADWEVEDSRGVKEYLEEAVGIECYPPVEPWRGGIGVREHRTSPQPTLDLKAGETFSFSWQTERRQLKNVVVDPFASQNPLFPAPGLYSVHATLDVITDHGTVRLRSNEQLVPVGGSREMPRHTYGELWHVNGKKGTGMLGLGSLHKVRVGDTFDMTSKQSAWRLTITEVSPRFSEGTLKRLDDDSSDPAHSPEQFRHAVLSSDGKDRS